jgi:small redox-active disulfide protein 2
MNDSNKQTQPSKSPLEPVPITREDLGVASKMEIKVLGPGCPKCKTLEKSVINALAELDLAADVSKVEDIVEIMNYGVMATPALVINGKVVMKGRVPSVAEIKSLITK